MITGTITGNNTLRGSLNGKGKVSGSVNSEKSITGQVNGDSHLQGEVSGESEISGTIGVYSGEAPPDFDGDYAYTSDVDADYTVDVRHKRMTGNLTIRKIPYYETSNIYGTTVIIGD